MNWISIGKHHRHSAARRTLREDATRQDRRVPHGGEPGLRHRGPLPAQGRAAQPGHRARRPVTCPLHNWVISLETGKALGADEGSVKTIALGGDGAMRSHHARRAIDGGGVRR
jgi:hypothetical protein